MRYEHAIVAYTCMPCHYIVSDILYTVGDMEKFPFWLCCIAIPRYYAFHSVSVPFHANHMDRVQLHGRIPFRFASDQEISHEN